MISLDSVVALHNTFVTADKLSAPQLLRGLTKPSELKYVIEGKSNGLLVRTKSYEILVNHNAKFLMGDFIFTEVTRLKAGNKILTAVGFQNVLDVLEFSDTIHMVELVRTKFEPFLAEGFYLI